MIHFEIIARLGASDRPDETRPIAEAHGATLAEAEAGFRSYLESLCAAGKVAAAKRIEREAKARPCACHWSHVPALKAAAAKLRSALDRETRAETAEAALADIAAADRARAEIERAGGNAARIEADCREALARLPVGLF